MSVREENMQALAAHHPLIAKSVEKSDVAGRLRVADTAEMRLQRIQRQLNMARTLSRRCRRAHTLKLSLA